MCLAQQIPIGSSETSLVWRLFKNNPSKPYLVSQLIIVNVYLSTYTEPSLPTKIILETELQCKISLLGSLKVVYLHLIFQCKCWSKAMNISQ